MSRKGACASCQLVEKALAVDDSWFVMWAQAELLHQKESHKEAYKVATATLAKGLAGDNFFWKDRVETALAEWPKK